tara:strand:- start:1482 stop:2609 length:1128 start_codon:yes stop_codon:yes gene_type:complete
MESIRQTPNGSLPIQSVTLARNGDLVHKIYIEWAGDNTDVASSFAGTDQNQDGKDISSSNASTAPSSSIDNIEVEIGGQLIDRMTGEFIQHYGELTENNPTGSTRSMFQSSILRGKGPGYEKAACWTPLPFWFCRNPGLAIPLIALQYHEVKLNLTYRDWMSNSSGATGINRDLKPEVWVDYIYLDTDERRRFAQVSHEYLIEQVQHQSKTISSKSFKEDINLIFNHPVKELIWVPSNRSGILESTPLIIDTASTFQLKLNGQDRFAKMDSTYFTRVQPWKYHTGGSLNWNNTGSTRAGQILGNKLESDYINVYSFALKPEEHQPSGTCNFSRIDSAVLKCDANYTTAAGTLDIYAVNYNVLRIMSGMGGLAYSN